MKIFIAIVNHNHDKMIIANPTLDSLTENFPIAIKSNTPASQELSDYCSKKNITLIQGYEKKGFGANNNELFFHFKEQQKMHHNDYFLVLNPDVEIQSEKIQYLLNSARTYKADISTINLFTDKNYSKPDNSIRHYPKLLSPLKSLLGLRRSDIYDKSLITQATKIEWAAGSFLLFKASCFEALNGFDQRYFMYFEDVDICTRANNKNFSIYYFPEIKAIHYTSHQNKNLFSRHFLWYWKSSLYYHLSTK
ncbi:glycosyltransferase [Vibrio lentus]|uniref:glycosyltransferase n=1 Tax=Vibrio lentus TaxID=136468 RepID=UPI000C838E0E|nr:glycosyltransferase family 2 protein [Vibrio lentus]PMJ07720.1 glycosyl transferase [Vibrio lentus]PMN68836.1 glycosyl transferase [Vibrio lentus]